MGEVSGRRGLVPSNMVTEVQVDDPDVAAQLLRESGGRGLSAGAQRTPRGRGDWDGSRGASSQGASRGPSSRGASRPTSGNPPRQPGMLLT